jgi:HEPN domain-containing protein
MALDPVRIEDTRSWLVKAVSDLRRAERSWSADPEDALFHCQQAAEKALTWHDTPFEKTRDLGKLCLQCAELASGFGALRPRLAGITAYAWRFRYPGAPYEPSAEEAQDVLARVQEALAFVLSCIPLEAHP